MTPPLADQLRSTGARAGLDAVGFAKAELFASTLRDLEERKAAGLHGGMQFTYRKPERSADPTVSLPNAASLVVAARSYRRTPADAPAGVPPGRVASYVWEDHYAQLHQGLSEISEVLRRHGHATRILVDDNALVDREAAYRAGLGWYGKNANVLLPGRGSWFVLGSVLTDAELQPDSPVDDGCGTCVRCIDACPTGAIVAPGVVDARRCLAWLVQAEGTFPVAFRQALGDRMYGCDDCQEVCPPNRKEDRKPVPVTLPAEGAWVSLLDVLTFDDDTLMERHGAWYVPRRDPNYLRRNALIALGNTADATDERVQAVVQRYLQHDSAMVRRHAVWACRQLGLHDYLQVVQDDSDPGVQAELAAT